MELNNKQKIFIHNRLVLLKKSKFRSSFHLRKYMIKYIQDKGMDKIEEHCFSFIDKNLAIYSSLKDGKQTPMKNHPVFIAQHATATCCRGCLEKWHHIPKEKVLEDREKKFIAALILSWIKDEYNK